MAPIWKRYRLNRISSVELLVIIILIPSVLNLFSKSWRTWRTRLQFQEAIEAFHAGNSEMAGEALQELVDKDSELASAHEMLGRLAFEKKDRESAVDHYGKALEIRPESISARVGLASSILLELDREPASREDRRSRILGLASKVLREGKAGEVDLVIVRAQLEIERGELDKALNSLRFITSRRGRARVPSRGCLTGYYRTLGNLQHRLAVAAWNEVDGLVDGVSDRERFLYSSIDKVKREARQGVPGLQKALRKALDLSDQASRNLLRAIQLEGFESDTHRRFLAALSRAGSHPLLLREERKGLLWLGEYYHWRYDDLSRYWQNLGNRSLDVHLGVERNTPRLQCVLGAGLQSTGDWQEAWESFQRARLHQTGGKLSGEAQIAELLGGVRQLQLDPALRGGAGSSSRRGRLTDHLMKQAEGLAKSYAIVTRYEWADPERSRERVVRILNAVAEGLFRESGGSTMHLVDWSLRLLEMATKLDPRRKLILRNQRHLLDSQLARSDLPGDKRRAYEAKRKAVKFELLRGGE